MLRDSGYGALTVDTVAELAGVAKTTLYRRWPSKAALVAAAIAPLAKAETTDVDGILEETKNLLRLFEGADAEALDVIAPLLRPRHERIRQLAGEEQADQLLGALLVHLFVTRRFYT